MTLADFQRWLEAERVRQGVDAAAEIRYIDVGCDGAQVLRVNKQGEVEIE